VSGITGTDVDYVAGHAGGGAGKSTSAGNGSSGQSGYLVIRY
jgi:hypothetical protein